eukprot:7700641-Karenia_brevis.AAC.1
MADNLVHDMLSIFPWLMVLAKAVQKVNKYFSSTRRRVSTWWRCQQQQMVRDGVIGKALKLRIRRRTRFCSYWG